MYIHVPNFRWIETTVPATSVTVSFTAFSFSPRTALSLSFFPPSTAPAGVDLPFSFLPVGVDECPVSTDGADGWR